MHLGLYNSLFNYCDLSFNLQAKQHTAGIIDNSYCVSYLSYAEEKSNQINVKEDTDYDKESICKARHRDRLD